MPTIEMSAKTIEDAVQAACDALGVDRNDENVSYEVLEYPARKLFKTIPAKVRLTVTEPEAAPAAEPAVEEPAAPAVEQVRTEAAEAVTAELETMEPAPAAPVAEQGETVLDIAADPRLQAAVDYLTPIFKLLGVEEFSFTAVQQGEATILRVQGEHMGALIGRRGETMESLSYLASLVVNRMEGPYVKLGLDVGGYRSKREEDLSALATRIANKVKRSGYRYEMEPMNPYERHIVHSAIAEVEGVRSESDGEGPARHVVIYSTAPDASNELDRDCLRRGRGGKGPRRDGRGPRRDGGRRDGRGPRREGRGPRRDHDDGRRYGGPRSSVPPREFADTPRDPEAKPMAPARTERIHDGEEFAFGKIDF